MRAKKFQKKGVAPYVSWILLLGFSIMLSVFIYVWMNSQVEARGEDIKQRADTSLCDEAGIAIKDICQNTQTLNMNITNVKLQAITRLNFRFFDLYDNSESRSSNITLRPQDTKSLEVIKQGTLKEAQIIPIIRHDEEEVTCAKSMVTIEKIRIC